MQGDRRHLEILAVEADHLKARNWPKLDTLAFKMKEKMSPNALRKMRCEKEAEYHKNVFENLSQIDQIAKISPKWLPKSILETKMRAKITKNVKK